MQPVLIYLWYLRDSLKRIWHLYYILARQKLSFN
jgi:hypothetical protein